jgi:hypothetical protein
MNTIIQTDGRYQQIESVKNGLASAHIQLTPARFGLQQNKLRN